jgi:hypothetical protein
MLSTLMKRINEPRFAGVVSHVAIGDPAECIVKLADDLQASLIVVGTSRKQGVARLLLGSTAEKVVRLAKCPVLVSKALPLDLKQSIQPPCPRCLDARRESQGARIWCATHRDQYGLRHTYHYRDKNSRVRENMPLLFPMSQSH